VVTVSARRAARGRWHPLPAQ